MSLISMVKIFLFILQFFLFESHLENKQLDRREYNLWTLRTAVAEITDEDWASIQGTVFNDHNKKMESLVNILEHVRLDRDENISKEKFLTLNDFEVQNKDTN